MFGPAAGLDLLAETEAVGQVLCLIVELRELSGEDQDSHPDEHDAAGTDDHGVVPPDRTEDGRHARKGERRQ